MDKEALLSIILSDIKEVETLIKSFQGKENIATSFIDLTERKILHITEELHMLKDINEIKVSVNHQETPKTVEKEESSKIHINSGVSSCNIEADIAEPISIEESEKKIESPTENIQEEPIVVEKKVDVEKPMEPTTEVAPVTEDLNDPEPKPIIVSEEKVEKIIPPEETIVETPPIQQEEENAAPEPIKTSRETKNRSTLGESLNKEKQSVNDIISTPETKRNFLGKPIADLTKGLGINDRFLYQRELFDGNADVMIQTLSQLNAMSDFNQAMSFLKSNFSWDNEEVSQSFYNYIQRKF